MRIRELDERDWPAVAAIFAEGIESGNATFETDVPNWDVWDASHLREHRLVATEDERVVGWAALAPTSSRACYRGVVEESVYVATERQGRGIGGALLERLIAGAEAAGIWTIEAGIFPENTASLALHERCGFRVVGLRKRIAQMQDGTWRDVVFLERRSAAP